MIKITTFENLLNLLFTENQGQLIIEFFQGQFVCFEYRDITYIKNFYTMETLLNMWNNEENSSFWYTPIKFSKRTYKSFNLKGE